MSNVLVQTVCTRWTKQSRGAPTSTRRNATPEQLTFAPPGLLDDEVTWHEATFSEPDFGLREAYRGRSLPSDFLHASIFFEPDHQTLLVRFFGSIRLRLARGQSGRIRYNLSDDAPLDGWYQTIFQKVVLHVAFGLTPQPNIFFRVPDQEHVSIRDMT